MSDEWLSITDQQLHDRTIAAGENESGGTRGSASGFFATIFETMAVAVRVRLARRYPPDRYPH